MGVFKASPKRIAKARRIVPAVRGLDAGWMRWTKKQTARGSGRAWLAVGAILSDCRPFLSSCWFSRFWEFSVA